MMKECKGIEWTMRRRETPSFRLENYMKNGYYFKIKMIIR